MVAALLHLKWHVPVFMRQVTSLALYPSLCLVQDQQCRFFQ
jgi:hypothetical protein